MKIFKKITLLVSLLAFFFLIGSVLTNADDQPGVYITPPFSEISPGGNYQLTIINKTKNSEFLTAEPALFAVNYTKDGLVITNTPSGMDLAKLLTISDSGFELNPGQTKTLKVNYIAEVASYMVGVIVKSSDNGKNQIGVVQQVASVIVKTKLTEQDYSAIIQQITVTPKFGIGGINFGHTVKIDSLIDNETDKLLKPGVELAEYKENTRLSSLLLTTQLPVTIYPKGTVNLTNEMTDSRPFWQRIGNVDYYQIMNIGTKTIIVKKGVLNIPYEAILIVLILAAIVFLISYFGFKLRHKKKTSSKTVHNHVK